MKRAAILVLAIAIAVFSGYQLATYEPPTYRVMFGVSGLEPVAVEAKDWSVTEDCIRLELEDKTIGFCGVFAWSVERIR